MTDFFQRWFLPMTTPSLSKSASGASRLRGSFPCARLRNSLGALALALVAAPAALANGFSETPPWQFQSRTDKVNQAVIQDMVQKRQNGMYTAPVYTTIIDRQINCTVTASATGNHNTSNAVANSPSTSGAQSSATGNSSANSAGSTAASTATSSQGNSGSVGASLNGGTSTQLSGQATQALNTTQDNSGYQTATVGGSSGCSFGTFN